jgi:hypothetical protein
MPLLIALTLTAVPAVAARQDWPAATLKDEVQDQNALLEQAVREATAAGVYTGYAARVIGRLRRYIEDSTAGGRSTAICLGMVVDVVKSTADQNWTVERASQFLIVLQKNLEALSGRCSSYLGDHVSSLDKVRPPG